MSPLEARALLNGDLAGTWIGQDQHDFVGPNSVVAPDGVQDIHLGLTGLVAGKAIASVDVQGLGGGEWESPTSPGGPWAASVARQPGSTTADVYIEPYQVETGRPFSVQVTYTDGSTDSTWVQGGAADPNLRMPAAALTITSVAQVAQDYTGLGPDVGPDGFQDVDLKLSNLSPDVSISDAELDGPAGSSWASGHNPDGLNNADLVRSSSDPTKADLYIQPNQDLDGKALTLTIDYSNGKTDTASILVSTHTNPALAMPAPAPLPTVRTGVSAQWIGQDGLNLTGLGDVHVHLTGIPAGRTVVAATLSDEAGADWDFKTPAASSYYVEPFEGTLGYKVANADPTQADISFSPDRSEAGSTLTLRLQLDDGSIAVVPIAGGAADPGERVAGPASTSIVAKPGADLKALANAYGSVHLSAGEYDLSQPLILNHPVSITADPGVTLMFSEPAGATPWTAAILINDSHTTLDGFAVRFAGPIVWDQNVQYGPAVIGSSDNINSGTGDPKVAETLENLDIEAPPASTSWEQTPDLIRFVTAANGVISGNTLKGGTTEVQGGPWTITNNDYQGTVPDTYSPGAFAAHEAHDLVLSGNTAEPVGNSGKTYRFLVMNGSGVDDVVSDNDVVGIGPMDDDTEPDMNSPEIILTESYSLHFEGAPAAISGGGLFLQIPAPQGGAARTGDVVSILSGPDAGQYRTIAQAIDAQTYLMDSPLPAGSYAISISTGFVGETYEGNTVDARGSSGAVDLDLQGNQFGAKIEGNTLLGGNAGFLLDAAPTESPNGFGWSHAPFLGATISGNTIGDAIQGGSIAVTGGTTIQDSSGRVYVSAVVSNNLFTFSDAFLAAHPAVALTVGDDFSIDPGSIVLQESGDKLYASASAQLGTPVSYISGTVNGASDVDVETAFPRLVPPAPTNLRLLTDTGTSSSDGITRIADLRFDPVPGAAGYEYAVGPSTNYLPVTNPADFVPAGLAQGSNTVSVRAFDSGGNRGPTSTITLVYDTVAPTAAAPSLAAGSDSGRSSTDGITNVSAPSFSVGGDPTDLITLLRDGIAVASRTGPGTLAEPTPLADGTYAYSVLRIDLAGNTSTSGPTSVTIDTKPPVATAPTLAAGSDSGRSSTDGITGVKSPTFNVTGDPTDLIQLLRNGVSVASRTGPGTILEPTSLADGTYSYALKRTDVAGNTSISPILPVTIDTTPPAAISGFSVSSTYVVGFKATSSTDTYVYRVGTSDAYTSIGSATSFLPIGLVQGVNAVQVHAIDLAGNVGPDATVLVNTAPTVASGTWLGQDNHDFVGQSWKVGADGFQDIHIALAGLRAGHSIVAVTVQPLGGGEWVSPSSPGGPFAADLIESKGATTADLYLAPYQVETGRPYWVTLRYDDGIVASFWVLGGQANPSLRVAIAPQPAGSIAGSGPIARVESVPVTSPTPAPSATPSTIAGPADPVAPASELPPVALATTAPVVLSQGPTARPTILGNTHATVLLHGSRTVPAAPAKPVKHLLRASHGLTPVVGLGWKRASLKAHPKPKRV